MLRLWRKKKHIFLWPSLFVSFILSVFIFTHVSRFPSKAPYSNPYAGEMQGWRGGREDAFYASGQAGGGNDVLGRAPWGGWGGQDNIPMGLIPDQHPSPTMQRDTFGEWTNLVCVCRTQILNQQIQCLIMCFNRKSFFWWRFSAYYINGKF